MHHHLIDAGLRLETSIITQTGQAWSTHHIACLVGYGANGVHPYLLWEAVAHQFLLPKSASQRKAGKLPDITLEKAFVNCRSALVAQWEIRAMRGQTHSGMQCLQSRTRMLDSVTFRTALAAFPLS